MAIKNIFKQSMIKYRKARKLTIKKHGFVLLTAVCMVIVMGSDASGAELLGMYPEDAAHTWKDDSHQPCGWIEIDGQKYYFLPETGTMAAGWTEIDGQKYYFLPETGTMAVGWMEISGQRYYFLPETGIMASGRIEIDSKSYYFYPDTGWMMTGWADICGESYYFRPDTGQKVEGWMKIDGESYYFLPETGIMASGWMKIDGGSYYFLPETGIMASGCWEIEDDTYYFSPENGEMLAGWQETEMGRRYFSKNDGRMAAGWKNIKGRRYYFSKDDGDPAAGLTEINGKYYLFHPDGRLAEEGKTSIVHAGSRIYCADKNGKPAAGWQVIGKKLYYASKTGKVKRNTVYRGITFGSSGAAKNNVNARLKIEAMKISESITKKNMPKSQKLAVCWAYVTDGRFRYAAKYPNLDAGGWQRKAAYDMLSSHTGNCYSFACVFAALAEEAGFRPYIVCGRVRGSRDRMADGYTRHAWVRINGRYYDPEAHYAGWRRGIYGNSSYPVSHTVQKIVAF